MNSKFVNQRFRKIVNDNLDLKLTSGCQEGIELSNSMAREAASQNRPPLTGGSISVALSSVVAHFNELLSTNYKECQAESNLEAASREEKDVEEKRKELGEERDARGHELGVLETQIGRISVLNMKPYRVTQLMVGFLILGETLFNSMAFLFVFSNNVSAFFGALGISVLVGLSTKAVPWTLQKFGTTKMKRTLLMLGWTVSFFLLFFGIGYYRVQYMDVTAIQSGMESTTLYVADEVREIGPAAFAIVNMMILVVGAIVLHVGKPSDQDLKRRDERTELVKKRQAVSKSLDKLNDKDTALRKKLSDLAEYKEKVIDYAKGNEQSVIGSYQKAISQFIHENLIFRPDKGEPRVFSQHPPRLKTYFGSLHISNRNRS